MYEPLSAKIYLCLLWWRMSMNSLTQTQLQCVPQVKIQAVKAPFYTPEGDEGEEEYVVAFRLAGLWRFVFLIL